MPARDADFSLKWVSGSNEGSLTYQPGVQSKKQPGASLGYLTMDPTHAQFTVPIGFGFDGFDVRLQDPTQNETQCLNPLQLGTQAFRQGIDCIDDPDFIDINMLVIPGMWAPTIVNYGIAAAENRGDTFYIAELTASSAPMAANQMTNLGYGSNYAAAYYPAIKVVDPVSNLIVTVPPSVPAAAAVSYTDRVAFPWYAPAGLNRGALNADTIGFTVVETVDRLTQAERDLLYAARVNPIASFPGEGIAIWGQKTMQVAASALDRVNVRRLLIKAKKFIASTGKYLLFEPNNATTWTRFKQLVNPFLQDIQIKNGLTQFLVVMDSTTNTPDLIDRNQMAGTIYLVPTRAAETLTVDFVVSRTGATFSQ
jgi:phage tail sheath protein FI